MELEQFREIWKEEGAEPSSAAGSIKDILAQKSRGPVARMRRNLQIECWLVCTSYGAVILYYLLAFNGSMMEVAWFMLAVALLFLAYYLRKRKLLQEMECTTCQLRSNLEKQLRTLEKYVRFYLVAGTLLAPVSLFFFVWLFSVKTPAGSPASIWFPSPANSLWNTIPAWILLGAVLTLLIYRLNQWYVRKLYGDHIRKLRSVLDEMEADS